MPRRGAGELRDRDRPLAGSRLAGPSMRIRAIKEGIAEGIFEFWWKGETLYASQQRRRRQLSFWLEQLAGGGGNRTVQRSCVAAR